MLAAKTGLMGIAILTLGLAATSGLALYYRREIIHLRQNQTAQEKQTPPPQQPLTPKPSPTPTEQPSPTQKPDAAASRDETKKLNEQIGALKAQLIEKDTVIALLQQKATNIPSGFQPRRDREQWWNSLKTNDPVQYNEMMKQREEAQQRARDSFARKASHFLNRDTSTMSEEDATQYNTMLKLLDDTWKLADQMHTDLPPEQRQIVRQNLRDNIHALSPLLDAERDREFLEIGHDIGYTNDQAKEFVSYLNNVIEVTTMRSLWEGMRPNPPGNATNEYQQPKE